MLLHLEAATLHYGTVAGIREVSIGVDAGEMVGLIGANGAGKSTTLRAISGLRPLSSGRLLLDGRDVTRVPAHERVRLGIAHAPEGRMIFPGMTVLENLEMGAYARPWRQRSTEGEQRDRVFSLFPRLAERRGQAGGTLSGGEQQMLAIGRALMASPKVLLLDEPSMGLAPKLVRTIFEVLSEINQQGTTILLVEQNAVQALARCSRAYVLEVGRVVRTGTSTELLADDSVRTAYLGGPAEAAP